MNISVQQTKPQNSKLKRTILLGVTLLHGGLMTLFILFASNTLPSKSEQPHLVMVNVISAPVIAQIVAHPQPVITPVIPSQAHPQDKPSQKQAKVTPKSQAEPSGQRSGSANTVSQSAQTGGQATSGNTASSSTASSSSNSSNSGSTSAAASGVITPPKFGVAYLNNPAPKYPTIAKRQGEEGEVLLRVLVSEDGQAQEVRLQRSSGSSILDDSALKAVKRWRFIPAKQGSNSIAAWVQVPIVFKLD